LTANGTPSTTFTLRPIGFVRNARSASEDDNWGCVESSIELTSELPDDALAGIDQFSHAEIIFYFHSVTDSEIVLGARHPRGNKDWPLTGIFAQRAKGRPNRLGLTTVQIVARRGRTLVVRGLDAIDGTPVLDIKPVMREFLPRGEITQPAWVTELMQRYW
jgi:tRNA-Thr(GGU) m(6)t(6)A37 methyltransferase TsaA